jgi:hypothetical protein
VRLSGASIGGGLDCERAAFRNPNQTALLADGATIGGDVRLRNGFQAEGLVRFNTSTVGLNLDFWKAQFTGDSLTGLMAEGVTVARLLDWREVTTTERTILDLAGAKVGQLADDQASWPLAGQLDVDGFVYMTILDGPMGAPARLDWLKRQSLFPLEPGLQRYPSHPKPFRPQSYQQLAKVLRESGYEADAKKILIARERARRIHGRLGGLAYIWTLVKAATIGYGYQPHRVLYFAVGFIMLGWLLFGAGDRAGMIMPVKDEAYKTYEKIGQPPPSYPMFNPAMYSLDTFLPIVNFGQKDAWAPNATCRVRESLQGPYPPMRPLGVDRLDDVIAWGADTFWLVMTDSCILHWYRWWLIAVGWLLTTLAVAGFTGLVRRE